MVKLTDVQKEKINRELLNRPCSEESMTKIVDGLEELLKVTGRGIDGGTEESPFRMFKAYLELTKGYSENPDLHLTKTFDVDCKDVVIIKDIDFVLEHTDYIDTQTEFEQNEVLLDAVLFRLIQISEIRLS